jgi:hypothetical protein
MNEEELARRLEEEATELERSARKTGGGGSKDRLPRSAPGGFAAVIHMMTGFRLGFLLWFWLFACIGAGAGIIVAFDAGSTWIGLLVCVPFTLVTPAILTIGLVRFLGYRRWQENLPYLLEGNYDDIVADRSESDHWRKCGVRVELLLDEPEHVRATAASLRIFCARANRNIYNTRWGKIARWSPQGLEAYGDANIRVAWKLYRFLSDDLAGICHAGIGIARVTVSAGASRHVPAETEPMS